MSKSTSVKLAGVVFCNSVSQGDGGKINCRGLFTSFLVWAYPTALRNWHAVLMLHELSTDTTSISLSISHGRGKKTTLATVDVQRGKIDVGSVVDLPLQYRFDKEGFYTLHFRVVGSTTVLRVPLKVTTMLWPRFTKKQIQFLKDNPSVPHSVRTNILCGTCSRPFNFEESVLPDAKLAGGVLPFPESGKIECESCGRILHLKDIQGQLRNSIKNLVVEAIGGGR